MYHCIIIAPEIGNDEIIGLCQKSILAVPQLNG